MYLDDNQVGHLLILKYVILILTHLNIYGTDLNRKKKNVIAIILTFVKLIKTFFLFVFYSTCFLHISFSILQFIDQQRVGATCKVLI